LEKETGEKMSVKYKKLLCLSLLMAVSIIALSGCAIEDDPPTASFTMDIKNSENPLRVYFDASSSSDPDGQIIDYHWDFGDGSKGTKETVTHTYGTSGSYKVKLTVRDDGGKPDTMTSTITLESNEGSEGPTAEIAASETSGEAPLEVSFDGSNSSDLDGSIETYHWNFGDGFTKEGEVVSHRFDSGGTYEVELRVTDNEGNTDLSIITVNVAASSNDSPSAHFSADPTYGEAPLTVSFDASDSYDPDGFIESYHWDFDEFTSEGTGMVTTNTFDYGDEFVVKLTVTDNDGSKATTTRTITVANGGGCQYLGIE